VEPQLGEREIVNASSLDTLKSEVQTGTEAAVRTRRVAARKSRSFRLPLAGFLNWDP
jgi:hypothetical protein